jgi:polyhydroxyalkanoate synthesis regulator phasin
MTMDGFYTFNSNVVIPILTKSMQEQQKEIQELKHRLSKLEEKIGI